MKRIFLLLIFLLAATSCAPLNGCENCTRVLFIGNSYTYVNDLPKTFSELSNSGGHQVQTGMSAQGGWTFTDHVNSADTTNAINSKKWDFVILQEQSEIPSSASARTGEMFPAAKKLVQAVKNSGATPIFFNTWAHKNGWPENGLPNYSTMQTQLNIGYLSIAQELHVEVSPVGEAWNVLSGNPQFNLWQDDGSHPTVQGTYLAACVFYAVIFHQSPEGLNYTDGLSKDIAQIIQTVAAQTVLENPAKYNLP